MKFHTRKKKQFYENLKKHSVVHYQKIFNLLVLKLRLLITQSPFAFQIHCLSMKLITRRIRNIMGRAQAGFDGISSA